MRQFCEALPADRLLQGNDCNLEGALAEERLLRTFTEPLTGAKLTYSSSLPVLAHFVGCLVRMPIHQPNLQLTEDSPITAKQHCKRHTSWPSKIGNMSAKSSCPRTPPYALRLGGLRHEKQLRSGRLHSKLACS